ncbi:hypothetical protein [Bradyrhizobium cenepequi]|uniref:hypothetical protein n=1 Tax=Bradyrhizobium cenepequi TaxID=2821403 RepID=UPI001CE29DEA|nr:hypothetical protein [Bradyrhizobium cenepequi]
MIAFPDHALANSSNSRMRILQRQAQLGDNAAGARLAAPSRVAVRLPHLATHDIVRSIGTLGPLQRSWGDMQHSIPLRRGQMGKRGALCGFDSGYNGRTFRASADDRRALARYRSRGS